MCLARDTSARGQVLLATFVRVPAPRAMSCAWHVTGPHEIWIETCSRAARETRPGYGRTDGTPASLPRWRGALPRHDAREQQDADLPRRLGSRRLPPHPSPRRAPLRVADAHPLPARQPLPRRDRNAHAKPVRGHARPQRRLRTRLQRAAPSPRPRLRPPVPLRRDRVRGAVRADRRIRPPEPCTPRFRRSSRGLALDVGANGPSDRFAPCRTTPTS